MDETSFSIEEEEGQYVPLGTRTRAFALRVVRLVQSLSGDDVTRVLGRQLLRSATSVGANYRAAGRARSNAEFIAKLGIVEEKPTKLSTGLNFSLMLVASNLIVWPTLSKKLMNCSPLLSPASRRHAHANKSFRLPPSALRL